MDYWTKVCSTTILQKDLVFNARMGKERPFDVNFTPTFGFKTFSVTSVVKFRGHEPI